MKKVDENIISANKKDLQEFCNMVKALNWEDLTFTKALKKLGITYIGSATQSTKLNKSYHAGTYTYGIYLAPWNLASRLSGIPGMNNCACGQNCHKYCLNGSGHNKGDIIAYGEYSHINVSRVKKTILFYYNRKLFMFLVIHEIHKAKLYAEKHNLEFSVRINCTSDLNIELFNSPKTNKNILKIFGDTQFYDYTKISSRYKIADKYDNYHLTFSFDGKNWDKCQKILKNHGQVAVVFDGVMPTTYKGYKVISGDNYDMRYKDPHGVIIGLTYHKTAENYNTGEYIPVENDFVVRTSLALVI